ncbi:MAG TPA: hypothetical protein VLD84_11315 [Nitrososphaeraceae archaeon]|nr:hypothetical protein [Nitrososphaeraceae archaeon]
MDTYFVIVLIHILVGFFLVYVTAKAYKRTKYFPMLLLTFGFFLIVIGDTVLGDFLNINDESTVQMIEELAEISGFLLVIVAVIKS